MSSRDFRRNPHDLLSIALFGCLLGVALSTFQDYGITWDEIPHTRNGQLLVDYYGGLLKGESNCNSFLNAQRRIHHKLYLYGGLFDLTEALAQRVVGLGVFETAHLVNALVGILGILGCWKLARLFGGPAAAFWAALLLTLTPQFYGHIFANPKDIPFACGYVWSMYFMVLAVRHLPRIPTTLSVKLGIAIGCTLASRVGGLILFLYLLLSLIAFQGIALRSSEPGGRLLSQVMILLRSFFIVFVLSYAMMIVFWPFAQQDPIGNPLRALQEFTSFDKREPVLFHGRFFPANRLPSSYLLEYLLITLPESVFGIGFAALLLLASRHRLLLRSACLTTILSYSLVIFSVLFPALYIYVKHSVIYSGMRHVMFTLLPLMSLLGVAICFLERALNARLKALRFLFIFLLLLAFSNQTRLMYALHPYQSMYYNSFIGGLQGAFGRYDTDYWGSSYREAVLLLVDYLRHQDPQWSEKTVRVMVGPQQVSSSYYFPPNFLLVDRPEESDFFISTTRQNYHLAVPGRVILTVQRLGVPLAFVKDRRSVTNAREPSEMNSPGLLH